MSDTLRFCSLRIKKKAARCCAETVDGSDSLWKALEKSEGTHVARTLLCA